MLNLYYKIISFKNNTIKKLLIKFQVLLYKNKIKSLILNHSDEVIFVYDLRISSIAFGDFFYSIYFLRFLKFKKIKFIVINDFIRDNYRYKFNDSQKRIRVKEFNKILNFLLYEKASKIIFNCLKWDEFTKLYGNNKRIIFKKLVLKKKPIYQITHKIIVTLFNDLPTKVRNQYNLKKIKNLLPAVLNKKYITVGFRIDYKNELERNFNLSKINIFLKYLYNKHKCNILIVSDKPSQIKIKKYISNKKYFFYSKDYTNSFIEDGNLILNSLKYYQYKASGISVFAEHSKIPCEVYYSFDSHFKYNGPIRSNYFFKFNKKKDRVFYPWTKKKQFFCDSNNFVILNEK